MLPQFIVIANPENRRVSFLQEALKQFNLSPAIVIPYADLITEKETLDSYTSGEHIIRFDSPERNFETEKAILSMGAHIDGNHKRISKADLANLEFDKGRIRYPRQLLSTIGDESSFAHHLHQCQLVVVGMQD